MLENDQLVTGAVLYCDGGAKPSSQGFIGWGAHGYIYQHKTLKKPNTVDSHLITNAGYIATSAITDKEIPVEPINYLDFSGSELGEGTNNRAETLAFMNSVKKVVELGATELCVISDSEYLVKGITQYLAKWHSNNYTKSDGNRVANIDIWMSIRELITELESKKIALKLQWIKGHNGNLGNVQADTLASIAVNTSMLGEHEHTYLISDIKSYWKLKIDRHPFLNFNRLYFCTVDGLSHSLPGHYYLSNPSKKEEFLIGKRLPQSSYSVVRLNEPDVMIEETKQYQRKITNGYNIIAAIRLDQLYHPTIYRYLRDFKHRCLSKDRRNFNLNFIGNNPLTIEMNPVGLTYRAVEAFNYLDELLEEYLGTVSLRPFVKHYDITDRFFDIELKTIKKEEVTTYTVKPDLKSVSDIYIELEHEYNSVIHNLKIPYALGLDSLTRNSLKKIEEEAPKVTLVLSHDTDLSIRYATIIEATSGYVIHSNFFADKMFLK
jgi:ribonuclease HI